jgi:hypothetical protein
MPADYCLQFIQSFRLVHHRWHRLIQAAKESSIQVSWGNPSMQERSRVAYCSDKGCNGFLTFGA